MSPIVPGGYDQRRARDEFEFRLAARLRGEKWVAEQDLEEAIRQQVILGGHLATNLWELGLVDGRVLSQLSAELLRVSEAEPDALAALDRQTLALLPADFVERERMLPLGVRRFTLRVATCEPWNHLAMGEAAYHAGYPVEPCFVAEVPLMRALAQHYGIPLRGRFRLPHPSLGRQQTRTAVDERGVPWDSLPELPAEIATVIQVGPTVAPISATEAPPADEPALEPIATLSEATAALAEAEDRDAVGQVLARFALSCGQRVVLLVYRRGQWGGWLGAGQKIVPARVRGLVVPAAKGTVFGLVAQTGAHFMGSLAAHPVHQDFLGQLGEEIPGAVGLFPVQFRGRLALAVYLDAGDHRDLSPEVAEILVLANRVPAALERLLVNRLAERQPSA